MDFNSKMCLEQDVFCGRCGEAMTTIVMCEEHRPNAGPNSFRNYIKYVLLPPKWISYWNFERVRSVYQAFQILNEIATTDIVVPTGPKNDPSRATSKGAERRAWIEQRLGDQGDYSASPPRCHDNCPASKGGSECRLD